MTKFRGWPESAFDFYARLTMDNTKAFWQANRATYDDAVRAPFDALSDVIEAEYGRPMNEWLARWVGPSTLPPAEP